MGMYFEKQTNLRKRGGFIMVQELEKRPGHTRWYISSLLSSMIILNYFDRVAISVAAPAIQDSFQLTATQLGVVFSIYTYSYTLMQLPVGSLLDRYGVAWVTRIGMAVWSCLTVILAFCKENCCYISFVFDWADKRIGISGCFKGDRFMVSAK